MTMNSSVDACSAEHSWQADILEAKFGPYEAMARHPKRLQVSSLSASIRRMRSGLPKLKGELVLGFDGTPYAIPMSNPGGGQGKMAGMRALLLTAMQTHDAVLRPLFGGRQLSLFLQMLDFPLRCTEHARTRLGQDGLRLPFFAMASGAACSEVPIPDFTFWGYDKLINLRGSGRPSYRPDGEQLPSGWMALLPALQSAATGTPFGLRADTLFWRGCVKDGADRQRLVPWLLELLPGALPAAVDVADTGAWGSKRHAWVPLHSQCSHKFLLHLPGNAYSAGLKYKLACGSVVIVLASALTASEFFYGALRSGPRGHMLVIDPPRDRADFRSTFVPRLRRLLAQYAGEAGKALGMRGARFVAEQLSVGSIACYWAALLQRYVALHDDAHRDVGGGRGGRGGRGGYGSKRPQLSATARDHSVSCDHRCRGRRDKWANMSWSFANRLDDSFGDNPDKFFARLEHSEGAGRPSRLY